MLKQHHANILIPDFFEVFHLLISWESHVSGGSTLEPAATSDPAPLVTAGGICSVRSGARQGQVEPAMLSSWNRKARSAGRFVRGRDTPIQISAIHLDAIFFSENPVAGLISSSTPI